MYTAQQKREREVFQQFVAALPSWPGLVTVVCPTCWQVVRTYETQVNGLNKYAYKYDSIIIRDEDGSLRSKSMYLRTEVNGHGCNHVKPEPVQAKKELAPLPAVIRLESTDDPIFEDDLDFDF